jgi:hypothetical protein
MNPNRAACDFECNGGIPDDFRTSTKLPIRKKKNAYLHTVDTISPALRLGNIDRTGFFLQYPWHRCSSANVSYRILTNTT